MQNEETSKQDQALQALLKDYAVPDAAESFYEQALARATHEGAHRQKKRWLMTGFGSAVAAGLVLWLIGGFFLTTPPSPTANPDIPGVTMTLEQPRTVNLVFASGAALDSAMLVAGARLRGELEERMRAILDAVRDSGGRVGVHGMGTARGRHPQS